MLQYFDYYYPSKKLQYFGHLMRRIWLTRKDPDPGKDWGQEKKGATKDETVG